MTSVRPSKSALEWIGPVVIVAVLMVAGYEIYQATRPAPPYDCSEGLDHLFDLKAETDADLEDPNRALRYDEAIVEYTEECPFRPVRSVGLSIEPNTAAVGETVHLNNGLCSEWPEPLSVGLWLAAQEITADPLVTGRTIPLVGESDTPEGRARETLLPGCIGTDGFDGPIPPTLAPPATEDSTQWRLVLHVVVTGPNGEVQSLPDTSEPFVVMEAE